MVKSCELVTYVTAIACFISENCSEEELPIICAMLSQLNDTLRTMIAQNIFCKKEVERILKKEEESEKGILKNNSETSLKSILELVKKDAEK